MISVMSAAYGSRPLKCVATICEHSIRPKVMAFEFDGATTDSPPEASHDGNFVHIEIPHTDLVPDKFSPVNISVQCLAAKRLRLVGSTPWFMSANSINGAFPTYI